MKFKKLKKTIEESGLMDLGSLPESDASNIAILPVVENPLFGLMLKNPV
ncbi:hypothetical protein [Xenorhabdus innexi]|uniref:Uncharacterized protein n=1 Tax=Xenorhabdus innexi TaxID=290109 RepID=A0A1N6MRH7_9GAMM|nr:hypothetical protein [Xenorhabdus innexi]PHM23927.1 hypothetical protein Xinn_04097 [Xenorhabdus innexi]SIP71446.1 hypothetical protein XIS1_1170002 [Xenorhabdus innexi]